MKPNPIGWFEIYVDNIDRAQRFYETVFQTKLEPMGDPTAGSQGELEMRAFPMAMEATGAAGVLAQMKGFKAGGNSVLVYFTSEDCAVEEKRISAAGGKVQKAKTSIGQYGFICLGVDTEGNIFGIHSKSSMIYRYGRKDMARLCGR